MTAPPKRRPLAAAFKRPLQKPFVGAYGSISWASANLMFDMAEDDLEVGMQIDEAVRSAGGGDEPRR